MKDFKWYFLRGFFSFFLTLSYLYASEVKKEIPEEDSPITSRRATDPSIVAWFNFLADHWGDDNVDMHTITALCQDQRLPCWCPDRSFGTQGARPTQEFQRQNICQFTLHGTPIGGDHEHVLRKIIPGQDGRLRIQPTHEWPHGAVGVLALRFRDTEPDQVIWGTGTLITPYCVLTAAHNLYSHTSIDGQLRGEAIRVRFFPGMDGKTAPFGEVKVKKFFCPQEFMETSGEEEDYGLLILEDRIGDQTGFLGIKVLSREQIVDQTICVSGYPGDKVWNQNGSYEMWGMDGPITGLDNKRLYYEIDTYKGQSGSGVRLRHVDGTYDLIGVHEGGDMELGRNKATRLTRERFLRIAKWIYDDFMEEKKKLDIPRNLGFPQDFRNEGKEGVTSEKNKKLLIEAKKKLGECNFALAKHLYERILENDKNLSSEDHFCSLVNLAWLLPPEEEKKSSAFFDRANQIYHSFKNSGKKLDLRATAWLHYHFKRWEEAKPLYLEIVQENLKGEAKYLIALVIMVSETEGPEKLVHLMWGLALENIIPAQKLYIFLCITKNQHDKALEIAKMFGLDERVVEEAKNTTFDSLLNFLKS